MVVLCNEHLYYFICGRREPDIRMEPALYKFVGLAAGECKLYLYFNTASHIRRLSWPHVDVLAVTSSGSIGDSGRLAQVFSDALYFSYTYWIT